MAALVLRLRDREMSRIPITTTRVTIGRDTAADLVIDNAGVSRTHAVVTFDRQLYQVEDADSQNGITVNGKPVKSATLEYGDIINIGKFEIHFVESNDMPVDLGGQVELPKRNVMRTLQMDAGAAARIRDEALARIAAQKGQPVPPRVAAARAASQPVAPPAGSDAMAVIKIAAIVLLAIGGLIAAFVMLTGD